MSDHTMELIMYSEKSFAVIGGTRDYKEQLKQLGGSFNANLRYNENKTAGWIFPKSKKDAVEKFLNHAQICEDELTRYRKTKEGLQSNTGDLQITREAFDALLSRVRELEKTVRQLQTSLENNTKVNNGEVNNGEVNDDESSVPKTRLLRRK